MEKQSKNQNYYIGLDLGTSTIGWAVVDEDLRLIRKNGINLWGVRLFDSANSAKERRLHRRQRRTYNKRSWRLQLLKQELHDYVLKEDPDFFKKIDASGTTDFKLFAGKYNDAAFHQEFPTIYHLREALKDPSKCQDYIKRNLYGRFLFLAVHDILKNRGHFLMPSSIDFRKQIAPLEEIKAKIEEIIEDINETYETDLDKVAILSAIDKKLATNEFNARKQDQQTQFIKALFGYQFDYQKLLGLDGKATLSFDTENWEDQLENENDEIVFLLNNLFDLYRDLRINKTVGSAGSYSASRIAVYKQHKKDLAKLKKELCEIDREMGTDHYNRFFYPALKESSTKKTASATYAQYIKKASPKEKTRLTGSKVKKEDLIKELKKIKNDYETRNKTKQVLVDIENDGYLDTPNNSDNRLIPYQLHLVELEQILENFKENHSKLNAIKKTPVDAIVENIKKLLEFKVPYFVGPLGNKGENRWIQKKPGFEDAEITPYNFDQVVDKQKTNEMFIKRMLRSCTYLNGEPCLQQETITYQKYIFYNTLNTMKYNDTLFSPEQKELLYNLLLDGKQLKKNTIIKVLGLPKTSDLSGFPDEEKPLPLSLSAHSKFRQIFPENKDNPFYQDFYDEVINEIAIIDIDEKEIRKTKIKDLAKSWKTITLNDAQIEQLAGRTSKKWGNLSRKFLCDLKFVDDNGEYKSMLEILENSSKNMMQIINVYDNKTIIDRENGEAKDLDNIEDLHEYLKEKRISPQARRTIIQTNRLLDEIVEIMEQEPERIAIEFTREDQPNKKTPPSRYEKLQKLYAKLDDDFHEIKKELEKYATKQDELNARDLYLYFTQLGKNMYTNEPININSLLEKSKEYDRDHIRPRSLIMDDSLDNLVLTDPVTNQEIKANIYPVPSKIQTKMKTFWNMLLDKELITRKKYEWLVNTKPLTDAELETFVNRQKTTLDWVNLETANILETRFNRNKQHSGHFIIYSKSNIVSRYRNQNELLKFREMNNLHHAHDALLNIAIGKTLQDKLSFTSDNNRKNYNSDTILDRNLKKDYAKYLAKVFEYHDILVTKKTTIKNTGEYWDQNMIPASESDENTQHRIKNGWDVKARGSYNKVAIAFFSVIETENGNKKIIPIPIVDCNRFYVDDRFVTQKFASYINDVHGNVKILVPILPINQKILIDGIPLRVGSRTHNYLICYITTEMIIPNKYREYIRSLFVIQKKHPKLDLTDEQWVHREITREKNRLAFSAIRDKIVELGNKQKYPNNTVSRVTVSKQGDPLVLFDQMDLKSQVIILQKLLLKLLRANNSNQGELFGTSYNDYKSSFNINYDFSIIKESITGFYTKRIDIHVSNSSH